MTLASGGDSLDFRTCRRVFLVADFGDLGFGEAEELEWPLLAPPAFRGDKGNRLPPFALDLLPFFPCEVPCAEFFLRRKLICCLDLDFLIKCGDSLVVLGHPLDIRSTSLLITSLLPGCCTLMDNCFLVKWAAVIVLGGKGVSDFGVKQYGDETFSRLNLDLIIFGFTGSFLASDAAAAFSSNSLRSPKAPRYMAFFWDSRIRARWRSIIMS